jgi:hypothetical protein
VPDEPTYTADAFHRKLAAELFNLTWELMEQPERTPDDDDRMLNAAHASCYHWSIVGTPMNTVRGDWQLARVNCVLGRPEAAMYHARRCLQRCLAHGIGDFDLAFAHEAIARAATLAGDSELAQQHRALAHAAGERIAEEDDREIFFKDLATVLG